MGWRVLHSSVRSGAVPDCPGPLCGYRGSTRNAASRTRPRSRMARAGHASRLGRAPTRHVGTAEPANFLPSPRYEPYQKFFFLPSRRRWRQHGTKKFASNRATVRPQRVGSGRPDHCLHFLCRGPAKRRLDHERGRRGNHCRRVVRRWRVSTREI